MASLNGRFIDVELEYVGRISHLQDSSPTLDPHTQAIIGEFAVWQAAQQKAQQHSRTIRRRFAAA